MNYKPMLPVFVFFLTLLLFWMSLAFGAGHYEGRRVLFVDSYHSWYTWSKGVEKGIRSVLEPEGVDLKVVRMDTKQNTSEEWKTRAGLQAMEMVERFRPEVVIASDDNAQKYFVVPYLLGTDIPVVFCGVNWDASIYGYPAENVTGMIEQNNAKELIDLFKPDARGDRIGYISGDTITDRKTTSEFNKRFFHGSMKVYMSKTFEGFKEQFLRAQHEVDMLFVQSFAGIKNMDDKQAMEFLLKNTTIPTGSHLDYMAEYAVYTLGIMPREHGEYAAATALRILDGEKPGDIPLTVNKQARLIVNLRMAKAAGIVVPFNVLKTAQVIGKD